MEAMVSSHGVRHRRATPVKTLWQMSRGPPGPRPAQGAGRPTIYGAEGSVEAADAGEARSEGHRGQRHGRLLDEALRPLHPARGRHGQGRGAVVEEPALDEPERARDGGTGPAPRRRARGRLRPAAQAGAEARMLRGGRRGEEDDVARLGGLHGAGGAAVDPGGEDTREEPPVESRVTRYPGAVASASIEGHTGTHGDPQRSTRSPTCHRRGRSGPVTARRPRAPPLA